jgi:glycosyltransferase involved in cell wall biosynthesis
VKIRFIASMSTFAGGTMTYTDHLATELMHLGHDVVLQSDRYSLTDFGRQSYVRPVWTRDARYPLQNFLAAREDGGHDVVHVQHEYYLYGRPYTAALFPALLASLRVLDPPVITTIHGVLSPSTARDSRVIGGLALSSALAWPVAQSLQAMIAKFSDAVIVHDAYFKEVLVRECGASPDAVHVIPHGVSTDLSRPPRGEARATLGFRDEETVLLSFGYLARYKGLETLLDAFNIVGLRRPDLTLVIAGGPPARNVSDAAAYRASLDARISPSLRSRVRFVGYVLEKDIPSWFAAVDLAILTHAVSLSASGVLSLAQGYGVAVVAPEIPPFAASVTGPDSHYRVGSPEDLARVLEGATRDPATLGRLRAASRNDAERASWVNVARAHSALYDRLRTPAR